jgi:hypothetical protein
LACRNQYALWGQARGQIIGDEDPRQDRRRPKERRLLIRQRGRAMLA